MHQYIGGTSPQDMKIHFWHPLSCHSIFLHKYPAVRGYYCWNWTKVQNMRLILIQDSGADTGYYVPGLVTATWVVALNFLHLFSFFVYSSHSLFFGPSPPVILFRTSRLWLPIWIHYGLFLLLLLLLLSFVTSDLLLWAVIYTLKKRLSSIPTW